MLCGNASRARIFAIRIGPDLRPGFYTWILHLDLRPGFSTWILHLIWKRNGPGKEEYLLVIRDEERREETSLCGAAPMWRRVCVDQTLWRRSSSTHPPPIQYALGVGDTSRDKKTGNLTRSELLGFLLQFLITRALFLRNSGRSPFQTKNPGNPTRSELVGFLLQFPITRAFFLRNSGRTPFQTKFPGNLTHSELLRFLLQFPITRALFLRTSGRTPFQTKIPGNLTHSELFGFLLQFPITRALFLPKT